MEEVSTTSLLNKLRGFSTPTVANIVATYPENRHCLRLYDPWKGRWYTDQSVRCMFPEMGRRIGYAVTLTYSVPDPDHPELPALSFLDLIDALDAAKKPIVLACRQDYPPSILDKAGLFGGHFTSLLKACGVVGVVTNGPSRDIDEMRPLGLQYIMSGVTVGHGEFVLRAVNTEVSVAGMDVAPGDLIHMDEHGAVRFPASALQDVCDHIQAFADEEERQVKALLSAGTIEEVRRIWKSEA
jgi:4-hydroxy-4-methyl-2-oxoglutarate aldolase